MPALPPVPAVIRIVLKEKLDADLDMVNRFYMKYTGTAPTSAGLATACTHIDLHWGATVGTFLAAAVSLEDVSAEDLTSPTSGTASITAISAGGGACTPESAGTAAVIKQVIARRYRGGHPRVYIGGMCQGHRTLAQVWDPTWLAGLVTQWGAFITNVAADLVTYAGVGSASAVNVSFYQGFTNHTYPSGRVKAIPTVRATPLVDPITAYAGNPRVGSQRRRDLQSV